MSDQKSYEKNVLTKFIREFDSVITQSKQEIKGRLPEAIFVDYFLPFFASDKPLPNNDTYITNWLKVAGSEYLEVDILDNGGKVLFTVPAMASTNVFNPYRAEGAMSFSDIVAMAKQFEVQSPVASENYIDSALTDKFKQMYQKKHLLSDKETVWLGIFARYSGKLHNYANTASPTNKASSNISDDEMEF